MSTSPLARRTIAGLAAASLFAVLPPASASPARAQEAPPGTDIYLATIEQGGDGPRIGPPRRITDRPGYDNQPAFLPDGRGLLYTSYRGGQADTYLHDLSTGRTTRLTRTAESEYSPTVTPDGGRVSVVRVESDSTQRLWGFPRAGGPPRLLVPGVEPVGYHAWVDRTSVVLYVLGDPSTLRLHSLADGTTELVARDVGRSLHPVPGGDGVSFVQWGDEGRGWITRLEPSTGETTRLAPLPGEGEYYAWTPDGRLLAAGGTVLYAAEPEPGASSGRDARWREVADLAELGREAGLEIGPVSRLAVSPDGTRLAFVAGKE